MADWREVDIKVFLHPDRDPKFHFECDELPKGSKDNDYIFSNDEHPGFLLNYVLQEPTHGYSFPDDEQEALYSAKGEGCPTSKGQWGQFKAKEVKSGNKILVVRNLNQKNHEGDFGYTLRVTKTPHNDDAVYLDLDPGGTNTNGPSKADSSFMTIVTVSATTAILSALAMLAALRFTGFLCPTT